MHIDNVDLILPDPIVRQIREIVSDFPNKITVPFQGTQGLFSLLPEPVWYPDLKCLAFAAGFPRCQVALQLQSSMMVQIDQKRKTTHWINTSLAAYRDCMAYLFAGVPYDDDEDSEDDVLSDYAIQIIDAMNRIDPGCANSNMFWSEIAWDVSLGDWGSKAFDLEKS